MYQELQYLRDELNQKCQSYSEQGNKTINMVLLVWVGAITFLGYNGINILGIGFEDIPSYFAIATVFFISNLILYYTALKFYNNTDVMYKLAAYIIVFYEKRPSCTVKVGENICWELTTFENKLKNQYVKKNIYNENTEYMALTVASVMLMVIFLAPLVIGIFTGCEEKRIACIIMSLIYVIYLGISIHWLIKIPKCTYARDKRGMRTQHLKTFIEYAKETGHYTEEELLGRFGKKFLDDIGYTLTATNTVVS